MTSREAILADFQACTGIEDVELAICQLEAANWSLVDAVNIAMPSSTAEPTPTTNTSPIDVDVPPPLARMGASVSTVTGSTMTPSPMGSFETPFAPSQSTYSSGVTIADDFLAAGSSYSTSRTRMLEFSVQHNERIIHLKVPDNEDVKTLKTLLSAETGFPTCQLDLSGFRSSGNPIYHVPDRRKLSELNLPKENVLYLSTPAPDVEANGETEPDEEDKSDFRLIITNKEDNDKVYTLNFRPTQSVLNVKLDLSTLTSIPVSRQKWTGWPDEISDDLSLAQIGIPREHRLTVDNLVKPGRDMPVIDIVSDDEPQPGGSRSNTQKTIHTESDIEDDDDFVDASDMMDDDDFMSPESRRSAECAKSSRLQPLLPDNYEGDETMAAIKFSEEFVNRYGRPHPDFFPGSLEEAIKQSCMKPAKERKMLAVYLHHDQSVFSNVFCAQVLCAESVVHYLNENFVSFGWDATHISNRTRAVKMITEHFGSVAASTIRNMNVERFPVIALIHRLRGTLGILEMIDGNVTLDELMSRLLSAHEQYNSQLEVEVKEEESRAARDAIKAEQDMAYEMSLMADREKEAQKKRDEEERIEKEGLEAALKKSQEEEQKRLEQEKQQLRQKIKERLPKEPADEKTEGKPVSQLRFRVPQLSDQTSEPSSSGPNQGGFLTRRFLASTTLQTLLDYLKSEGYPSEEFKVLSSWPRRDLTTLDPTQSLKELKLYPQETLTLEEK